MEGQRFPENSSQYKIPLSQLSNKAIVEISKMKTPIIQFCSPISTGGFGNTDDNLEYLCSLIQSAERRGLSVFNQVSYEEQLNQILKNHHGYDYPILDFFYNPILTSRKISGLIFLPLWETSIGSQWEHEFAISLGIPVFHIEHLLFGEIQTFYKKLSPESTISKNLS